MLLSEGLPNSWFCYPKKKIVNFSVQLAISLRLEEKKQNKTGE